jgi:hypothetical protein
VGAVAKACVTNLCKTSKLEVDVEGYSSAAATDTPSKKSMNHGRNRSRKPLTRAANKSKPIMNVSGRKS